MIALMIVFQVVVFGSGFALGVLYGRRQSAQRVAAARSIALAAAVKALVPYRPDPVVVIRDAARAQDRPS